MDSNKYIKPISLLCMLLLLTACLGDPIRSWPVKTGRVVVVGSNKPIEGAIVVAFWEGDLNLGFVDSQSTCYHVESTISDKNGHYQIPAWHEGFSHGNIFDKYVSIEVFRTGYVTDEASFTKESKLKGMQYQRPFEGKREERLKSIWSSSLTCSAAEDSTKNLLPFYRALYEETQQLAVTKEEKFIVNALLHDIEVIGLSYEEALQRDLKRRKGIRNE